MARGKIHYDAGALGGGGLPKDGSPVVHSPRSGEGDSASNRAQG